MIVSSVVVRQTEPQKNKNTKPQAIFHKWLKCVLQSIEPNPQYQFLGQQKERSENTMKLNMKIKLWKRLFGKNIFYDRIRRACAHNSVFKSHGKIKYMLFVHTFTLTSISFLYPLFLSLFTSSLYLLGFWSAPMFIKKCSLCCGAPSHTECKNHLENI